MKKYLLLLFVLLLAGCGATPEKKETVEETGKLTLEEYEEFKENFYTEVDKLIPAIEGRYEYLLETGKLASADYYLGRDTDKLTTSFLKIDTDRIPEGEMRDYLDLMQLSAAVNMVEMAGSRGVDDLTKEQNEALVEYWPLFQEHVKERKEMGHIDFELEKETYMKEHQPKE